MSVALVYNEVPQFFDQNGDPLSGGFFYTYLAGTTTKVNTFTTSAGNIPNANPQTLDAAGRLPQPCWATVGTLLKIGIADSTQPDPPSSFVWVLDNVSPSSSASSSSSEWVASGFVPTYVSATSFTVPGDQTSVLTPRRAVQIIDAGGTKYGWIKTSVFTTLTTVTLDQNSTALASPISSVAYGLLGSVNPSEPILADTIPLRSAAADESVQWGVTLTGNTTATTVKTIIPNYQNRMMTQTHGADIASAATLILDTATGDLVDVTGTTGITAITLAEGRAMTLRFTGILTITAGASLICPGASPLNTSGFSLITEAGATCVVRGYAAGVVRITQFQGVTSGGADGSGFVLLATKTAATSANLTFTTEFDWTIYDEYEFRLYQVIMVTNAVTMLVTISEDSGSSFKSTGYASTNADINHVPAGPTATNSGVTAAFELSALTLSNSTDYGLSGKFTIYRPQSTIKKLVRWETVFAGATNSLSGNFGIGQYATDAGAWNGVRFAPSGGGNISTGIIRAYGLKKS